MASVHSFRLRNSDHELERALAGMTGKEKSDFIRKALYFYIKYEHRINQLDEICSGVREILKRLDGMSVSQSASFVKESDKRDGGDQTERVLIESIQELLNL